MISVAECSVCWKIVHTSEDSLVCFFFVQHAIDLFSEKNFSYAVTRMQALVSLQITMPGG